MGRIAPVAVVVAYDWASLAASAVKGVKTCDEANAGETRIIWEPIGGAADFEEIWRVARQRVLEREVRATLGHFQPSMLKSANSLTAGTADACTIVILVHGRVSVPGVNFLVLQSAFAAEKQAQADWLAAQRDANPGFVPFAAQLGDFTGRVIERAQAHS